MTYGLIMTIGALRYQLPVYCAKVLCKIARPLNMSPFSDEGNNTIDIQELVDGECGLTVVDFPLTFALVSRDGKVQDIILTNSKAGSVAALFVLHNILDAMSKILQKQQ